MANTRDVVHSIETWRMANPRDDDEMDDLTGFLMKILAGTKLVAEALDRPLTRYRTGRVQNGPNRWHMICGTVR